MKLCDITLTLRVRLHSPSYLNILSGCQYPDILHSEFTKFTIRNIRILISKWNIRIGWLMQTHLKNAFKKRYKCRLHNYCNKTWKRKEHEIKTKNKLRRGMIWWKQSIHNYYILLTTFSFVSFESKRIINRVFFTTSQKMYR